MTTTHRRHLLKATLAATIAWSSVVLPVRGAGATIIASATGSGHTTVAGELRIFSFAALVNADGVATGTGTRRRA